MGVATVGLLHATVRRWHGHAAALIAGAVTALTPVAVLMFRFNNPDALLVLLAGRRGVRRRCGRSRPPAPGGSSLAGALVGLGFLTKMLQALLVVPAFALVYLVAAPSPAAPADRLACSPRGWRCWCRPAGGSRSSSWCRRSTRPVHRRLAAQQRPRARARLQRPRPADRRRDRQRRGRAARRQRRHVGSDRLDPDVRRRDRRPGRPGCCRPRSCCWSAGLVRRRRAPRTDRTRASLLLWGGWLLVTGLTFSFMQGIFHAYYTVALAPAIGALVGIGAVVLWAPPGAPGRRCGARADRRRDRGLGVRAAAPQQRLRAVAAPRWCSSSACWLRWPWPW